MKIIRTWWITVSLLLFISVCSACGQNGSSAGIDKPGGNSSQAEIKEKYTQTFDFNTTSTEFR
ncbi:MAG: hypothetical protein IJM53_04570 [Lachnospiraceae bacterium]|nr:hypothetical protein [Lachnospiraceae bacterium]